MPVIVGVVLRMLRNKRKEKGCLEIHHTSGHFIRKVPFKDSSYMGNELNDDKSKQRLCSLQLHLLKIKRFYNPN